MSYDTVARRVWNPDRHDNSSDLQGATPVVSVSGGTAKIDVSPGTATIRVTSRLATIAAIRLSTCVIVRDDDGPTD